MDFSGMIKWGLRITAAAGIIVAIMFILSAVSIPALPASTFLSGLDTVIAIFYYYVPTATVLWPLMLSLWGLSFLILATKFAIIGLRTLWRTSE